MSRVPMQKIITIKANNAKGDQGNVTFSNSTILETEAVKRLLNQPNILVRAVPIKAINNQGSVKKNIILSVKKNGLHQTASTPNKPQVPIQNINNSISPEEISVETLLPSKTNGKSEILIRPIVRKQKPCGHYESCEHLICDVKFQNYADESGVTPILARTLDEEDEITAPVSRHCANPKCDALSIDHNRCRRASIALYRFDKQSCCDICGIPLETRKLRANHRGCKRKQVYRHNEADSAEILRKKMRERELQLLDSDKLKQKDYLDPVNGHNKALEILRKNEELIVIPKNPPNQQVNQQSPMVTITTLPTSMHNSSATTKKFTVNNSTGGGNVTQTQLPQIRNVYGNVISSIPIVIGNQQGVLLNTSKQGATTLNVVSSAGQSSVQSPVITVTTVPGAPGQGNIIRPVILSNWAGNNQPQVITTSQLQPKPIITPIRVVPIANFKTQPSLLHQVQGMPKFCIMADSTNVQSILQPPPLVRIQTIQTNNNQQTIVLPNIKIAPKKQEEPKIVPKVEKKEVEEIIEAENDSVEIKEENEEAEEEDDNLGESTMLDTIRKRRQKTQHKFLFEKYVTAEKEKIPVIDEKTPKTKHFTCPYCNKKLGTEWYFKTHVARHKGETPYVCKVCEQEFVNSYEMKKHHSSKHTKQEIKCEFCPHIASSERNLKMHMAKDNEKNPVKCWACDISAINCEMLDRHQRLSHGSEICRNCGERMSHVRLMKHLILRHGMTKPKAQEEAERLSGVRLYTKPPELKTEDEDEVEIKQECNGEEYLEDEITIKEEVGDVDETEYYEYESYNYEEQEIAQEDVDDEVVYETEETEQQGTGEEETRYVSEIQEDDEETQDLDLVLEEDEDADIESQFEEVFENGGEEMEVETEEQFGDDASLCNACGKMFANEKKYTEHRTYCADAAGTSDDASNSSSKFSALNGDS